MLKAAGTVKKRQIKNTLLKAAGAVQSINIKCFPINAIATVFNVLSPETALALFVFFKLSNNRPISKLCKVTKRKFGTCRTNASRAVAWSTLVGTRFAPSAREAEIFYFPSRILRISDILFISYFVYFFCVGLLNLRLERSLLKFTSVVFSFKVWRKFSLEVATISELKGLQLKCTSKKSKNPDLFWESCAQ